MARWLGVLYICGSTLSLVPLALPHWHPQDTTSTAICALVSFFSRRTATGHIVWIAVCFGAVLWIQHIEGGAAQWLLVVGTEIVSGLVVAALVEEVRSAGRRDGLTGDWNRRAARASSPSRSRSSTRSVQDLQ